MGFTKQDLVSKVRQSIIDKIRSVRGNDTDVTVVCDVVDYQKFSILYSDKLKVIVCEANIGHKMTERGKTVQLFSFVGNIETGEVNEIRRLSDFK